MDRNETEQSVGSGRALVPLDGPRHTTRAVGGRPMAEFLTQLLVGCEPALRPSRLDRTRCAAALYRAQTGQRG